MSSNPDPRWSVDARVAAPGPIPRRRPPVERRATSQLPAAAADGLGVRGDHRLVNGGDRPPDDVDLVALYGDSAERARPPSDWLTPPPVGNERASIPEDEPPDPYDEPFDELDYEDYFDDDEDEDFDVDTSATRNAIEWAVVLVGAVLVALVLRASLFQAFWIPSESMETTLLIHDRVLVNKMSYRLHEVHRGDVVVFARPDDEPGEIRDLIKRVIGVGGETVEARDDTVYINGQRLIEPYLDEGVETTDFGPIVVPEGEVFVMGDNRTQSYDSRLFGTVDEERIVGRAFVLFWPLNRIGSL